MNTAPWIARLQAQCPGFRFIGGALDLSETTLQAVQLPAAFVIPVSETGAALSLDGQYNAPAQSWAVALVIKPMRTKASADQSEELDTLRTQVKTALQGWQASPRHAPSQFDAGELDSMEAAALIWIDQYTTRVLPA